MADSRKESSVLFSLRELRGIEDERVVEEDRRKSEAEETRIRMQMEAERQAREAEEARIRAEQQAEQSRRDAEEQRRRDEELRLAEAERRARVDAQAALEAQRLQKEMEIRTIEASKKRPVALVVGICIALAFAVGGTFYAVNKSAEADEKEQAAKAREEKIRQDIDDTLAKISVLDAEKDERFKGLIAAKTEEEKVEAQKRLDDTERRLAAEKEALKKLREATREKREREAVREQKRKQERKKVKVNCDPSDPLCGI